MIHGVSMKRPHVHVNCASTLDGRISRPDGSRLRISGPDDIRRVHRLRQDLGSILIGAGTVIADDPKLTVKTSIVTDPRPLNKIVIDGKGSVPPTSRFLRTPGRSVIATTNSFDSVLLENLERRVIEEDLDVEILMMDGNDGRIDVAELLASMSDLGIDSILVEGGSSVIRQFVENGLFDRFTIYYGPMIMGGDGPSIVDIVEDPLKLRIESCEKLGDGLLMEFKNGS
jgi:2,5-diamino-6-(ribosylamino)-4(3H)-pyrimidinone 5'-phosphate reductase